MFIKKLVIVFTLCVLMPLISTDRLLDKCKMKDTCASCLRAQLKCAWCADKQYQLRYRCLPRDALLSLQCNEAHIYENKPEYRPNVSQPLKDYASVDDQAVQVSPQRAFLRLVKSQPQRIKLSYRAAQNNPLDLYVLMDLTWTMRDDRATLIALGAQLSQTLRNLTPNYRLGFGSFADKPAMPMIMPQLRQNPCAAERTTCEPTYGFRHHLPLTVDVAAFVRSVNASRITGNLDNLEGGLDALMQVIVCPEQIGWQPNARKVVILVSDGFMHFAGDGKLAGIVQPNDRRCHLSADGEYLGTLTYDYPSLEAIYRELLKRKVSVIFAVTDGVVKTYRALSALMQEITNVEILSADSSNILELIKKSYESFVKRTQFTDNSPDFIEIVYETDCGGEFATPRKRNFCNNVEVGKQVDFYVQITLKDYPSDDVYQRTIRIEESSLNEHLELDVELQHACPCSEPAAPKDHQGRLQCSALGYMNCGMCRCDEGWTGRYCECPTEEGANATLVAKKLLRMCRLAETDRICSDHGDCECGSCVCYVGYVGTFCECPECDVSCQLEHADCLCGRCECKPGWSGESCDCAESVDSCRAPNGDVCSERGDCQCGECRCEQPYRGRFCEFGSELENKVCGYFERCVICLIERLQGIGDCKNLTEFCPHSERYTHSFVTEEIALDVRCMARLTNQYGIKCDSYFTYKSVRRDENYLIIQANECKPADYVAVASMIGAVTVILGLVVLAAIAAVTRYRDAREYQLFDQQTRATCVQIENPLYKDPVTHYTVPDDMQETRELNPFADL